MKGEIEVLSGLIRASRLVDIKSQLTVVDYEKLEKELIELPKLPVTDLRRVAAALDGWSSADADSARFPREAEIVGLANVHVAFVLYVLLQLQLKDNTLVFGPELGHLGIPIAVVLRGKEEVEDRTNRTPWGFVAGRPVLMRFSTIFFRSPDPDANLKFLKRITEHFHATSIMYMSSRPLLNSGLTVRSSRQVNFVDRAVHAMTGA